MEVVRPLTIIDQLTAMIKQDLGRKRTKKESLAILIKAEILTDDGELNPKYFSEETINADKQNRKRKRKK